MHHPVRVADELTASILAALAGLHVAWGLGSTFPFRSREALAESVVGTRDVPAPGACYAVAGCLLLGAGLVRDAPTLPAEIRRTGLLGMTTVLAFRAALGWAGRTDLVSPGSTSSPFRRLDRRIYAPLCAMLAVGSLTATRERR